MDSLSYEILQNWQVRKTKAQKLAFIEMMQSRLPGLRVEEGGFPRCRNLVLGDPETAKVVFTAHYDTCARLPFPNFITPKNFLLYLGYNLLILLPFFALMALLTRLLVPALDVLGFQLSLWIPCLLMIYLFILGPANPHTVNDNTSGVLTLVEIIRSLSEEERSQLCFVFFDHEESGLFGSASFKSKHKKQMKDKLLVNFDCVGRWQRPSSRAGRARTAPSSRDAKFSDAYGFLLTRCRSRWPGLCPRPRISRPFSAA